LLLFFWFFWGCFFFNFLSTFFLSNPIHHTLCVVVVGVFVGGLCVPTHGKVLGVCGGTFFLPPFPHKQTGSFKWKVLGGVDSFPVYIWAEAPKWKYIFFFFFSSFFFFLPYSFLFEFLIWVLLAGGGRTPTNNPNQKYPGPSRFKQIFFLAPLRFGVGGVGTKVFFFFIFFFRRLLVLFLLFFSPLEPFLFGPNFLARSPGSKNNKTNKPLLFGGDYFFQKTTTPPHTPTTTFGF